MNNQKNTDPTAYSAASTRATLAQNGAKSAHGGKKPYEFKVAHVYCPCVKEMVELTIGGLIQGAIICGKVVDCSKQDCTRAKDPRCRLNKEMLVRLDE
jgi:hypothetical protein